MHLLATVGRIVDALLTAAAVVLGLTADPSAVPVERDPWTRR